MNHLVVFSHPNPQSFNRAILNVYTEQLSTQGHEVRVRDLYAMQFDPVLKADELAGFKDGRYPPDIAIEHDHIRWAQVLTLICPIWWGGFTANLRGYLDRVLSLGFAYSYGPSGLVRLLQGKKVVLIHTLGDTVENYQQRGFFKSMDQLMDDIAFDFCGLQVIGRRYFGSVTTCSDAKRKEMLEEVRRMAERL